jgi:hypothetical protein
LTEEELADPAVAGAAKFTLDLTDVLMDPDEYLDSDEQKALSKANWVFQVAHMDLGLDPSESARMADEAEREMGRLEELAWQRREAQRAGERRAARDGQVISLPVQARPRTRARTSRTSAGSRARRAGAGTRAGPGGDDPNLKCTESCWPLRRAIQGCATPQDVRHVG